MNKQVVLTEKEYNSLVKSTGNELLDFIFNHFRIESIRSDFYDEKDLEPNYYLLVLTKDSPSIPCSCIKIKINIQEDEKFMELYKDYENNRKNRNLQE